MTITSTQELHDAVYQQLAGSAPLTTLLGGVNIFDDVPQGTLYPYVTIGDTDTRHWHTQTEVGHEHRMTLHVWSQYAGRREVHQIIDAIDNALDGADLTLGDHVLINLRTIFWTGLRDLDGETYHGIIRFRAVTESTI